MKRIALAILFSALASCASSSSGPIASPSATPVTTSPDQFTARTAHLQKLDGFIPLFWDAEKGRLLLEVSRFNDDFIYQDSLAAGVGSNPIGLDRGEMGATRLVHFERVGPRVLLVESNTKFRALTTDANERAAVADSFAQSVLAGFTVEASSGDRTLLDATDFFLSDAHAVMTRLRDTQQGTYTLDRTRSAIYLPRTKAFPRNSEIEVTLTFETGGRPGPLVSGVSPVPEIVSVREHHSLVKLPEPGFKPRRLDPRVAMSGIELYDYASPFTGPLEKRWIARHRLEKKDPNAAVSDPVEPIVYYVDNGVPEPIRSALVEGASWWGAAFEAAGFHNAFIVKVLPDGADPMDIRYNMVNWVHRSTRGWSYGESIVDPRTGEIIKGNVRLGSLRIRQDFTIGAGLIPQYDDEQHDAALATLDPATSPAAMALARIRQLAAHEVGHTLGLDHNMAASSYGRASVMDYPAPLVRITNGKLDLSQAYGTGVGPYDLYAIRYGYSQFAPGVDEDAALNRIAREAPLFVKDDDARPISAAHPNGSLWDGGSDSVESLRHEIEVRRIALEQFGLHSLPVGMPLSSLEELLVPLYLHHRYQLEAAAKSVGGLDYTYAVREKEGVVPADFRRIVAADRQRDALKVILSTLEPSFLVIPQRIVDLIPPRANGYEHGIAELFDRRTTPSFDPITAAMSAADIAVSALLEPHRDARLIAFHAENSQNPTIAEVLDGLIMTTLPQPSGYAAAVTRSLRSLVARRMMELADNPDADSQVQAEAAAALRRMTQRLGSRYTDDPSETASRRATIEDINRFLARPAPARTAPNMPAIPPGPPI